MSREIKFLAISHFIKPNIPVMYQIERVDPIMVL